MDERKYLWTENGGVHGGVRKMKNGQRLDSIAGNKDFEANARKSERTEKRSKNRKDTQNFICNSTPKTT